MIFEASKTVGWSKNTDLHHLSFGLILGEDGKKLKSRSGESYKLSQFLDEAKEKSLEDLLQRQKDTDKKFTQEEAEDIADKLAVACIKYSDLK